MRNFSQKIFTDRYATSINMDLADWYLTVAAEERERQGVGGEGSVVSRTR